MALSLMAGSAVCQQVQWAVSGGTWVDDTPNNVVVDKTGNIYTTGHIGTFGKFFGTDVDEWGYYLLKQNKAGVVKWMKFSKSSYDARGEGLAIDSKGNVYVAGSYHYNMDLGDTILIGAAQGPASTLFFIKYDSLGNRKWARTVGPDGQAGGALLTVDQQDNLYLGSGYYTSVILENGLKITSQHSSYYATSDVFLSRWTTSGHPIWGISLSATGDDRLAGLQTGPDGNVYVLGQNSSGDFMAGSTAYKLENNVGSYLVKCSLTGAVSKVISLGYGASDLAISNAGEFYVSGVNLSLNSYVSKLRSDFAMEWSKPFKNNGNPTNPVKVALSGSDVYVGTNYAGQLVIDSTIVSGVHGLMIAKFSGIGVLQWVKNYSGGPYSSSTMTSLASSKIGEIVLTGTYSDATYKFDSKTIVNNSGNNDVDVFVALFQDPTTNVCPTSTSRASVVRPIFCRGDSLKISTNTGEGYYRLDWYFGNQLIKSVNDFYAKQSGSYHYIRYPGSACEQISNNVNLELIELAPKTISPADTTTCEKPATIKVAYDPQYTYQWYKDTKLIPGESSPALVASQSGTYYCSILKRGLCETKTTDAKVQILTMPTFKVIASPLTSNSARFFPSDTRSITSYQWTVTGTTLKSIQSSPIFTFSSSGSYQVCLRASNAACNAMACTDYSVIVTGLEDSTYPTATAFPNPFSKAIFIANENFKELSASIFDMQGRLVENVTCRERIELDTSSWPAGMYVAHISNGDTSTTIKLIKK